MNKKPVIVVGAGPVGLMNALYLARVRKLPVVIVEQQEKVGGLYAGVETPWGRVDQGVHIPQETGIPEIDKLFFDVLPHEECQIFEGVRKDIAGNIFSGHINKDSLYPDLRLLQESDFHKCLASIFSNVKSDYLSFRDAGNLKEYFESRFGNVCTQTVFEPIARKIWKQPLEKMSPWAAKIVHLIRVITHEQEVATSIKMSPMLDAIIGFPEQLTVPTGLFSQQRRAIYPKKNGLDGVVTGFIRELNLEGVKLLTSSGLTGVEIISGKVNAVELKNTINNSVERLDVSAVVWTSPLPPLMKLLGVQASQFSDEPLAHRVVHLFLDKPAESGSLYWLWSFESDNCLVRVSFPYAYCSNAVSNGVYPVCVEMHVSDKVMSDENTIRLAEEQLRKCHLIMPATRVVGASVLDGLRSFFVPTVKNCHVMASQRSALESIRPNNLFITAQDLNAGVFYMPDILCAGISQLDAL